MGYNANYRSSSRGSKRASARVSRKLAVVARIVKNYGGGGGRAHCQVSPYSTIAFLSPAKSSRDRLERRVRHTRRSIDRAYRTHVNSSPPSRPPAQFVSTFWHRTSPHSPTVGRVRFVSRMYKHIVTSGDEFVPPSDNRTDYL